MHVIIFPFFTWLIATQATYLGHPDRSPSEAAIAKRLYLSLG